MSQSWKRLETLSRPSRREHSKNLISMLRLARSFWDQKLAEGQKTRSRSSNRLAMPCRMQLPRNLPFKTRARCSLEERWIYKTSVSPACLRLSMINHDKLNYAISRNHHHRHRDIAWRNCRHEHSSYRAHAARHGRGSVPHDHYW